MKEHCRGLNPFKLKFLTPFLCFVALVWTLSLIPKISQAECEGNCPPPECTVDSDCDGNSDDDVCNDEKCKDGECKPKDTDGTQCGDDDLEKCVEFVCHDGQCREKELPDEECPDRCELAECPSGEDSECEDPDPNDCKIPVCNEDCCCELVDKPDCPPACEMCDHNDDCEDADPNDCKIPVCNEDCCCELVDKPDCPPACEMCDHNDDCVDSNPNDCLVPICNDECCCELVEKDDCCEGDDCSECPEGVLECEPGDKCDDDDCGTDDSCVNGCCVNEPNDDDDCEEVCEPKHCTQQQIDSGKKVNVCHYPAGDPAKRHTICISINGWENGHEPPNGSHGDLDTLGACETECPGDANDTNNLGNPEDSGSTSAATGGCSLVSSLSGASLGWLAFLIVLPIQWMIRTRRSRK